MPLVACPAIGYDGTMRWFGLTLSSSLLLPLALPNELFPTGHPLFGIVALVPLFLAYREARSFRRAVKIGTVFAVVSTFLANYWLMFFGEFSVWTITGVIAGYVLFHLLTGPILYAASDAPPSWRPFVLAVVWTCYEYLTSIGYLGYPWGLIAYPVSGILPLIQHVDITGVWSLSFLLAAANGCIAELLTVSRARLGSDTTSAGGSPAGNLSDTAHPAVRRLPVDLPLALRQSAVVVTMVTAALVYGWIRLATPFTVNTELDVVLVQQNADSWATDGHEAALRTAQDLSREGVAEAEDRPDLVAWSETSLRYPYIENRRYYETHPVGDPFVEFVRNLGAPLLTGNHYVLDWDARESLNAAILLSTDAEVIDFYGKQHPVPFAEHVPFWEYEVVQRFFREVVGLQAIWVPGNEYTIFSIENSDGETVRFGTPICFEDSFAYIPRGFVLRGADVLINLTNNSWSRTDSAQIQHFVAARFRAIENRRTLVRSTNSGVTVVVDAYGRSIAELPMFESRALRTTVPIYTTDRFTAYTVLGDYLGYVAVAALAALAVLSMLRTRRRITSR